MRLGRLVCVCVAVGAAVVAAQDAPWHKVMQDVTATIKQAGDDTADAVAHSSAEAAKFIAQMQEELEDVQGPIKEAFAAALSQATATLKESAGELSGKVQEGMSDVHTTMQQLAETLKEALQKDWGQAADDGKGQAKLEEKHRKCFKPCSRILLPVCGSDGKTHPNRCEMERYACEHDAELTVVHIGRCDGLSKLPAVQTDPCWRACTKDVVPVCGSDGKTYLNECLFKIEQCHMGGEGMLSVKHQGRCDEDAKTQCMKACTREYMPLCGSDGKTYSNKCVFEIAQCVADATPETPALSLEHIGKCKRAEGNDKVECPMFCVADYKPVCGSDGQTYTNKCMLNKAACKLNGAGLVVEHEGECVAGSAALGNNVDLGRTYSTIGIVTLSALSVLTAVAMASAIIVVVRRINAPQTDSQNLAPPPYSKLLNDDNGEADPDELFSENESGSHEALHGRRGGYTPF